MPAGSKPGERRGGRIKGTPNADKSKVRAILERENHCPFTGMINIAENNVKCTVCRGALRTKYSLPDERPCRRCLTIEQRASITPGEPHDEANPECHWCAGTGWQTVAERPCASCNTSGMEPIEPRLMGQMESELAQYIEPKRKAIELSGDPDNPINHAMTVRFVKANAPS